MLHVRLIGVPRIEDDLGDERLVRGQKPWALLARIVLADGALTRRELSAELFPEAVDPLGSLRWCLASLRKTFGSPELFTGDPVGRDLPDWIKIDVVNLRDGVFDPAAVGELLEGVDPPCGPEFSTWLLVARQQVGARVDALVRDATIAALSRHELERALELAELAARRAPYDEGAQILLVKALVMAGHAEAAARHVAEVEALFARELGCDPTPALRSAARASVAESPPGVSPRAVASSLLTAGRSAISAGAIDAGLDCLRRAAAQAETAGDTALLGQCLLELGSALVHSVRGFDDEGSVLLDQAVHLGRETGDRHTAVNALRERGYADTLAGRRHEAVRHLSQAFELAASDTALLPGLHAVSALNLSDWGRYADSIAHYESAVHLARSVGDRRWEGWALGLGGWTALIADHPSRAIDWTRQCLQVVHDLQWTSFQPWPEAVLAETRLRAGAGPATALAEDIQRCFAISCQLEDPCWEGASCRVLALHHASHGDTDAALRWITEGRRRAQRRSDTWAAMIGAILLAEAEIRLASGDGAGLDASLREVVAYTARTHQDALLQQALTLLPLAATEPSAR